MSTAAVVAFVSQHETTHVPPLASERVIGLMTGPHANDSRPAVAEELHAGVAERVFFDDQRQLLTKLVDETGNRPSKRK